MEIRFKAFLVAEIHLKLTCSPGDLSPPPPPCCQSHELRCNGRLQVGGRGLAGPWSSRRSVLRLSGEARRPEAGPGAGAGPTEGPTEGPAKRLRPDGQDPSDHPGIMMLTTGMEEGAGASPGPGVRVGVGVRGRRGTLGQNPSLDRTSTPSTAEPSKCSVTPHTHTCSFASLSLSLPDRKSVV